MPADFAGARDMGSAAGLEVEADDLDQPHAAGPVGGLTDMVLTRPGLAASCSSLIQRVRTSASAAISALSRASTSALSSPRRPN